MENSNITQEELELYLSEQHERLNFRLLWEFGVPAHDQDSVLWIEDVKIIMNCESL